jgi:gas vesicle protein
MSDNSNDLGAFLAGFVIGGLVGAATALILAPQSGEETRMQIVSRSNDLRQAGSEQVRHYREVADSYAHDYLERAEQVVDTTRHRIQEAGDQVQEQARIVLDSGKERAAQVRDQVNTYVQRDGKQNDASTEDGAQ